MLQSSGHLATERPFRLRQKVFSSRLDEHILNKISFYVAWHEYI